MLGDRRDAGPASSVLSAGLMSTDMVIAVLVHTGCLVAVAHDANGGVRLKNGNRGPLRVYGPSSLRMWQGGELLPQTTLRRRELGRPEAGVKGPTAPLWVIMLSQAARYHYVDACILRLSVLLRRT